MPRKPSASDSVRRIALCYIRQSVVKDATDFISPERQRANIQVVCEREGWIPEWYEDAEGHHSGMHEHTRPGWLALKTRLNDGDVAALVANDLSRLHRKGWRVSDLIHLAEERGFRLVMADPSTKIDLDTPNGRLLAQAQAFFDEWYVQDISERRKASIAHRKSQGKSVGLPPFGTSRDKTTGFLIPSTEGAWLMPDGSWQSAHIGARPPVKDVVWRGYYDCTERILRLYADDSPHVLYTMHQEGWAFRDRWGNPAPMSADVIRRVIANWAEYGGFVFGGRARQRHPSDYPPDEIIAQLVQERSAFPLELLTQVAYVLYGRVKHKQKHPNQITQQSRIYPLGGFVCCSHCEREALEQHNPKLRSKLSGRLGKYYRHLPSVYCGVTNKSVRCERLEAAFVELMDSLQVKPETAVALRVSSGLRIHDGDETTFDERRAEAVTRCKQRIQAAVDLYAQALIPRQEFYRRIEENERELAMLEKPPESASADVGDVRVQAALCVQALETLKRVWQSGSDEDKRGVTRQLFDYLVYDLDAEQITGFQLKPWAEGILIVSVGD